MQASRPGIEQGDGAYAEVRVAQAADAFQFFYGGGVHHLAIQALGVVCIAGWVIVTMSIVFIVLKKTIGLRVSKEEELEGLDSTEHGLESAYPDFVTRELH